MCLPRALEIFLQNLRGSFLTCSTWKSLEVTRARLPGEHKTSPRAHCSLPFRPSCASLQG